MWEDQGIGWDVYILDKLKEYVRGSGYRVGCVYIRQAEGMWEDQVRCVYSFHSKIQFVMRVSLSFPYIVCSVVFNKINNTYNNSIMK